MRENIQYLSIFMAPKLVHLFSPEFLNHENDFIFHLEIKVGQLN